MIAMCLVGVGAVGQEVWSKPLERITVPADPAAPPEAEGQPPAVP